MGLEHLLKAYRVKQASARDLPCFSVLGDALIRKIVESKPRDAQGLAGIRGMSKQRCEWYGEDILRLIKQAPRAAVGKREARPAKPAGSVVLRHSKGGGRRLTKPAAPSPYARAGAVACKPRPRVMGVTARANGAEDDVYILELAKGRVYVGKSGNVEQRVGQVSRVLFASVKPGV